MLFNSYSFILAYLPITVLGFFLVGRFGKAAGAGWLALCSLFFYGWWDYRYVFLLLASITLNFTLGRYIARNSGNSKAKRTLGVAVAANLVLLGYYKYADFFLSSTNAILGTDWPILGLVLPIGISFFTFTQIAFLVDAYAGKVTEYRFIYYVLFVTYFPHLIAGPVLHHREMMPQFDEDRNYRPSKANFAIGITIFAIGLAKKVLIADNLAGYASPVFESQAAAPTFFEAWGGVLAYSFQLYFDFSGYSDMAIGLSRLLGIRLPLNFNSPYKSQNIAEFWRRWHMTLSRFLRDYLYIPLGGNRHGAVRRQFNLVTTMVLGGLWHGAGWNFAIWGGLHGAFLVANQLWQKLASRFTWNISPRFGGVLGMTLTFFAVVIAWVYFRSPDLTTANRLVLAMFGQSGVFLPEPIMSRLGPIKPILEGLGVGVYLGGGAKFVWAWCWIAVGATIAFLAPNTQEIMSNFDPALVDERPVRCNPTRYTAWLPHRGHAVAVGLLLALGFLALSRPTEFLYFQF